MEFKFKNDTWFVDDVCVSEDEFLDSFYSVHYDYAYAVAESIGAEDENYADDIANRLIDQQIEILRKTGRTDW